jgi:hypothetical protein
MWRTELALRKRNQRPKRARRLSPRPPPPPGTANFWVARHPLAIPRALLDDFARGCRGQARMLPSENDDHAEATPMTSDTSCRVNISIGSIVLEAIQRSSVYWRTFLLS